MLAHELQLELPEILPRSPIDEENAQGTIVTPRSLILHDRRPLLDDIPEISASAEGLRQDVLALLMPFRL